MRKIVTTVLTLAAAFGLSVGVGSATAQTPLQSVEWTAREAATLAAQHSYRYVTWIGAFEPNSPHVGCWSAAAQPQYNLPIYVVCRDEFRATI